MWPLHHLDPHQHHQHQHSHHQPLFQHHSPDLFRHLSMLALDQDDLDHLATSFDRIVSADPGQRLMYCSRVLGGGYTSVSKREFLQLSGQLDFRRWWNKFVNRPDRKFTSPVSGEAVTLQKLLEGLPSMKTASLATMQEALRCRLRVFSSVQEVVWSLAMRRRRFELHCRRRSALDTVAGWLVYGRPPPRQRQSGGGDCVVLCC